MYIPMFQSTIDASKDFRIDAEELELAIICKPLYDLIEEKTGKPVAYLLLGGHPAEDYPCLSVCYPVGVDGELTEIPIQLSCEEQGAIGDAWEKYNAELKTFADRWIWEEWETGDITVKERDKRLAKNERLYRGHSRPMYEAINYL